MQIISCEFFTYEFQQVVYTNIACSKQESDVHLQDNKQEYFQGTSSNRLPETVHGAEKGHLTGS